MNNKSIENNTKKLRILRFSGVLVFVGTFILAIIYTGDDQFLKRCVANGNSIKYCNDIYDDRNLAFKGKKLDKEEKREFELAENSREELSNKDIKTKIYDNGDKYIGQFLSGEKHGQGFYFYLNGNQYVGKWRNDKRYGRGTYIYKNGRIEKQN